MARPLNPQRLFCMNNGETWISIETLRFCGRCEFVTRFDALECAEIENSERPTYVNGVYAADCFADSLDRRGC
jgi:hypothetical protein